jgi:hypothetical protein
MKLSLLCANLMKAFITPIMVVNKASPTCEDHKGVLD